MIEGLFVFVETLNEIRAGLDEKPALIQILHWRVPRRSIRELKSPKQLEPHRLPWLLLHQQRLLF